MGGRSVALKRMTWEMMAALASPGTGGRYRRRLGVGRRRRGPAVHAAGRVGPPRKRFPERLYARGLDVAAGARGHPAAGTRPAPPPGAPLPPANTRTLTTHAHTHTHRQTHNPFPHRGERGTARPACAPASGTPPGRRCQRPCLRSGGRRNQAGRVKRAGPEPGRFAAAAARAQCSACRNGRRGTCLRWWRRCAPPREPRNPCRPPASWERIAAFRCAGAALKSSTIPCRCQLQSGACPCRQRVAADSVSPLPEGPAWAAADQQLVHVCRSACTQASGPAL